MASFDEIRWIRLVYFGNCTHTSDERSMSEPSVDGRKSAAALRMLQAAFASRALLEAWVQANGIDVDVVAEDGKNHGSALLIACALEAEEACATLLTMSADVNVRSSGGTTPLLCCASTDSECLRTLLAHPALDVDMRTVDVALTPLQFEFFEAGGRNALHVAVEARHHESVSLLLMHAAAQTLLDATDSFGRTALDMAFELMATVEEASEPIERICRELCTAAGRDYAATCACLLPDRAVARAWQRDRIRALRWRVRAAQVPDFERGMAALRGLALGNQHARDAPTLPADAALVLTPEAMAALGDMLTQLAKALLQPPPSHGHGGVYKCEVRESSVHGRGVFATSSIACGEVVTCYPQHAISLDLPASFFCADFARDLDSFCLFLATQSTAASVERARRSFRRCAADYTLRSCTIRGVSVALTGFPEEYDPSSCAHLCNDACGRLELSGLEASEVDATLDAWRREALERSNAELCGGSAAAPLCHRVVATRDISYGEEVLVLYGERYWIKRLASTRHEDVALVQRCASLLRRLAGEEEPCDVG